jgi:hypothetical protein
MSCLHSVLEGVKFGRDCVSVMCRNEYSYLTSYHDDVTTTSLPCSHYIEHSVCGAIDVEAGGGGGGGAGRGVGGAYAAGDCDCLSAGAANGDGFGAGRGAAGTDKAGGGDDLSVGVAPGAAEGGDDGFPKVGTGGCDTTAGVGRAGRGRWRRPGRGRDALWPSRTMGRA